MNTAGQVVGVDTAGATGSRFEPSASEGMAIPINDAIAISKQIDSGTGSVNVHIGPTGILGIMVQEPTSQAEHGRFRKPVRLYGSWRPRRGGHSWLAE